MRSQKERRFCHHEGSFHRAGSGTVYRGAAVCCHRLPPSKKNGSTASTASGKSFEIPGGHIEPGESPEQAARRELYEETGALDYTLQPVGVYGVEIGRS